MTENDSDLNEILTLIAQQKHDLLLCGMPNCLCWQSDVVRVIKRVQKKLSSSSSIALEADNARLREALKLYALENAIDDIIYYQNQFMEVEGVYGDETRYQPLGTTAEKALAAPPPSTSGILHYLLLCHKWIEGKFDIATIRNTYEALSPETRAFLEGRGR